MARHLAPAVGCDLAVPGVQADNDVAREGAAGVMQKARVLDRGGADDDVADARVEIALDGVEVADAAAQLDRDLVDVVFEREVLHRLQDRLHGGLVLRLAGEGAVQVDQVQPARTLLKPVQRHLGGIFGKYGGKLHVALFQADAVTVLEVDGRYEQHGNILGCVSG